MRKIFLLLIVVFKCFTYSAKAQGNLPEFGKIDLADLQMKECPFDKGASAMNLINSENAEFEITQGGLFITVKRWTRIKIFTQNGFSQANIVIPFISKNKINKLSDITAVVYNISESGNIVSQTLEKKDLFTEKSKTGSGSMRFTFPNVKPGSIIEYKYTLEENNWPILDQWQFQDVIPTGMSVCKLEYNSDVDINLGVHITLPFVSEPDSVKALDGHYKKLEQSFTMRNIPAFRAEPMMSSQNSNLQRIDFSILPGRGHRPAIEGKTIEDNWAIYNIELLESPDFGLQFSRDIPGTKAKIDSIKNLANIGEKINAVYEWVKTDVKWDDNTSIYVDDLADVWKAKKGNNSEINLLILNFLRKVGVHCFPLLIGIRDYGKPDISFASLSQFDGVDILALDGNAYYILDGTQKYQSYKVPPYNVLNSNAFLVDNFASKWLYIEDSRELMKNVMNIEATIDSNGVMTGKGYIFYYDYAKVVVLSKGDDEDESVDLIKEDFTGLKIDSAKEENSEDALKPLVKSFNFKLDIQQTGDYYFLDPFFLSPFKKNPFIDSVRRTDVDFGSNQYYAINMHITLPGNMTASDLPANKEIRLADSSFSFGRLTTVQDNAIVVRNHLEILTPVFSVEEYPFLRQLFQKMYSLLNERIVLKRKN